MPVPRKLTQNFVETEVDGEVLLVDLDGGELFSLSGSAREVWRAIDGVRDETAIVHELAMLFDASQEKQISADVSSFLDQLAEARLIATV